MWQSTDPALEEYLPEAPTWAEPKPRWRDLPSGGGVSRPINLAVYTYAHQNPVRLVDPDGNQVAETGFWARLGGAVLISQADTPAPGPADAIALGAIAIVIIDQISGNNASVPDSTTSANSIPTSMSDVASDRIRGRNILFHYTSDEGLAGILGSQALLPSTRAANPADARYGDGQYFSNILPGTMSNAQLSRRFVNLPFQGNKFKNFVAVDVTGLPVRQPDPTRPDVWVLNNEAPLPLAGRIVAAGPND